MGCQHRKLNSMSTPPNKTIDYLLKCCWQSLANKYNAIAAQHGFTQAAGHILINIHKEGTSVSQLAAFTGVKTTSLSRILNNLEKLGFIYREVNVTDKRSVKVYLTELGQEKRELAKEVVRQFNYFLEARLTEKEQAQLAKTLTKISELAAKYEPQLEDGLLIKKSKL